jgi:RNA polymerase sigma-70 factor (ECF subfamily)
MWLDANSALAHLDRLNAAALAMAGNRADAEDLVQETVLTLVLRPRRLHGTSELAYLMTMLRNRHIDLRRSAARRRQTPAVYELEEAVDPRAGLRPDRVAEDREVVGAVHALESPFRETVVAVDVLGLSYKEAAKALGVPVGTVMSRLARGRDRVIRAVAPEPELALC